MNVHLYEIRPKSKLFLYVCFTSRNFTYIRNKMNGTRAEKGVVFLSGVVRNAGWFVGVVISIVLLMFGIRTVTTLQKKRCRELANAEAERDRDREKESCGVV